MNLMYYIHDKKLLTPNTCSLNSTNKFLVDSLKFVYVMTKLCNKNRYFCLPMSKKKTTTTKVRATRKKVIAVNLLGHPSQPLAIDPLDINSSAIQAYREKYKIKTQILR
jgi:hypothetical protein